MLIEKYITALSIVMGSILYGQLQYSDINAMLNDITPFENEIKLDYLNVVHTNNKISSIHWFDEDSTRFTKLFHYDKKSNLFLISEFRNQKILKEIYFTSYNAADRFIYFLFGDKFHTNEKYITEIVYNESKLPV